MGKKTEMLQLKLPYKTMQAYERFAKMSGVPVRSVIAVCLAIQVAQAEDMAKALGK